jgi:transcription initiation factor TFIID subunit TAF12
VPTPTVHCIMRPPRSLMAQLDQATFTAMVSSSKLVGEYATDVDPQSAKEMLAARMQEAQAAQAQAQAQEQAQTQARRGAASAGRAAPRRSAGSGGFDLGDAAKLGTRVLTSSTTNTLLRGIFGALTGSPARRRR